LKRYGGFDEEELLQHAPCCPGHHFPAKLIAVKKSGSNKGRKFYGCSYPAEQRCKFFMWAEDNPALIALSLQRQKDLKELDNSLGPVLARRRSTLASYSERLEDMTVAELKDEVKRCLRRRALSSSDCGKEAVKLKVGGSRGNLIQRLKDEAQRILASESSESNSEAVNVLSTKRAEKMHVSTPLDVSLTDSDDEDSEDINDDNDDEDRREDNDEEDDDDISRDAFQKAALRSRKRKYDDHDDDNDEKEIKGGYDYLMRLQFRSITEEKIEKLKNDIASNIKSRDELSRTSEKELWIRDLDEFEKAYVKWLNIIEKEVVKTNKKK